MRASFGISLEFCLLEYLSSCEDKFMCMDFSLSSPLSRVNVVVGFVKPLWWCVAIKCSVMLSLMACERW